MISEVAGFVALGLGAAAVYLLLRPRKTSSSRTTRNPRVARLPKMATMRQVVERLENGSTVVRPIDTPSATSPKECLLPYAKGPFTEVRKGFAVRNQTSAKGFASERPVTVMEAFKLAVARNGDEPALVSAEDEVVTWKTYYERVQNVAFSLVELGFQKGDSVNVIGFNSPEWLIANVAAIAAGGKAAGIYTSNLPDACQYVASHSEALVVVTQDQNQTAKFLEILKKLPKLKKVVQWEGKLSEEAKKTNKCVLFSEFEAEGAKLRRKHEATVEERISNASPGDACTLIYTSGTTGNPKAVAVTNDSCTWTAGCTWGTIVGDRTVTEPYHLVSYLPLSHIAAQMLDIHCPIFSAAFLEFNTTIYFADKLALKGTLVNTLQKARPHFFFGVPRVWEKIMAKMVAKGKDSKGLKKKLVTWAKSVGSAHNAKLQNDGAGSPESIGYLIAKTLVFSKVRAAVGLDRCAAAFTGAAPINHKVLEFFGSLDIPVMELYGMSECTGPTTVSYISPSKTGYSVGSTGPPLPGTELKIDHDKDRDRKGEGEICYRGRHIMAGYLNDAEKTNAAVDAEGWLHSGDVGRVDDLGMLTICGRIKELIISAGGENIAPAPVESFLKEKLSGVSNTIMIGDRRKYNVLLVTVETEPNADGTFSDKLTSTAREVSPKCKTVSDVQKDEKWQKYVQAAVDAYNKDVAVSNAQRLQKFTILDRDLSVPEGELGPTLKMKRSKVNEHFAAEIEALYAA